MRFLSLDLELGRNLVAGSQFHILFFQICLKLSFIMRQESAVLSVFLNKCLMPGTNIVEMDGRNLEIVAFHQLTIDGSRITLPENIISGSFQRILLKDTEILVGMHISLALGCFQIDIERAVIHLIGSHILDTLLLHDRIILRAPGNQIL